jgi:hypothetical protein
MKHVFFSICIIAAYLYAPNAQAQAKNTTGSGVYLNAQDYMSGKLSYHGARVRADIPFRQSAVKVVAPNQTKDLSKSEVYGYRDSNGQDYRFINNKAYKIVDKTHFPIYRNVETITKGKERERKAVYYFSAQPGSEPQLLTIRHLKRAFPDNDKFHNLLDLQFKNDKELVAYDDFRGEYKLKTIFNNSFNENKSIVQRAE